MMRMREEGTRLMKKEPVLFVKLPTGVTAKMTPKQYQEYKQRSAAEAAAKEKAADDGGRNKH